MLCRICSKILFTGDLPAGNHKSSHLKDFSYLCWKIEMLLEIFRLVSQVPSDHTTFVPQFCFGGIHWSSHFHIRFRA
ncbi:hypothetical protein NC653_006586 [Populus alba x Populus x berolinensis]|uniref:Uncharacterized protein n=1 Tax=Populus alba x Populus x berolinensis TaxID=444605 RepID=A0AAD6WD95_9ROSI|nr:hypothetical protein NC653_006586 [Populus alba x Populus x berolinensis]